MTANSFLNIEPFIDSLYVMYWYAWLVRVLISVLVVSLMHDLINVMMQIVDTWENIVSRLRYCQFPCRL